MAMSVGTGEGPKADINVTPMIDVLLVLLIIFMVITPLTPKGLEALAPQPPKDKTPPPDSQDRTVVVQIDRDRSLKINTEVSDWTRLGTRLEEIFKSRAERVVFIKGDPNLEYKSVAEAIDIARGVGIDKIGLMTPKVEAGE